MNVEHIMTTEILTVRGRDALDHVERLMREHHLRHLPVVDEAGKLEGIVSHRDLLEASLSTLNEANREEVEHFLGSVSVGDVMVKDVITISSGANLREAAALMIDEKIGCLPVVLGDKLIGIVTETDFLTLAWDVPDVLKSKKVVEKKRLDSALAHGTRKELGR